MDVHWYPFFLFSSASFLALEIGIFHAPWGAFAMLLGDNFDVGLYGSLGEQR
jgi:hypothetical protein